MIHAIRCHVCGQLFESALMRSLHAEREAKEEVRKSRLSPADLIRERTRSR